MTGDSWINLFHSCGSPSTTTEQLQKRQCSQEKRPLVSRGLAWLLHGHYLHVSRNVLIFIERPRAGFAPPSDYHELRLYYYYYFVYYGIETLVNILVRGSTQQICIYVWYTGFATEGKQAGRQEGPVPRRDSTWPDLVYEIWRCDCSSSDDPHHTQPYSLCICVKD